MSHGVPDGVLTSLRQQYGIIYLWHRRYGRQRYLERSGGVLSQSDDYGRAYLAVLDTMPAPEVATPESMESVARELLSGAMEWSYNEACDGTPLNQPASSILKILRECRDDRGDSRGKPAAGSLPNRGSTRAQTPQVIRIPLPGGGVPSREQYHELATRAYADVPSGRANIGGLNLLAESNLEVWHATHPAGLECGLVEFRNAAALHFGDVTSSNSLVAQAEAGKVSVLSVTIGGRHGLEG